MRRRLALLTATALILLPACGHTDRPEGVVERWLISLNQGKAGRPESYAPDALSQRVFPSWASKDPGELNLIEVGKGESINLTGPANIARAAVPFRVERATGGMAFTGVALLHQLPGHEWRVVDISTPAPFPTLKVPSQGGERVGGATVALWLEALGVALLLSLATMGLMSTVGRERRTA